MEKTKFEERLGMTFRNRDLFLESITHRSYLNENPTWGHNHNERMEFLGDAVLELCITESLYKKYQKYPEGKLTLLRASLVNYQILAKIASELELEGCLLMSRGEAKDKGKAREVILANAIEAVVGALYLDQGLPACQEFADKFIIPRVEGIVQNESYKDSKSRLQEIVQEKMRVTPSYRVLSEDGPAHARNFEMGVYVGEALMGKGSGTSKQEAEVEAAKDAIKRIV
jgi:ribonuclease III